MVTWRAGIWLIRFNPIKALLWQGFSHSILGCIIVVEVIWIILNFPFFLNDIGMLGVRKNCCVATMYLWSLILHRGNFWCLDESWLIRHGSIAEVCCVPWHLLPLAIACVTSLSSLQAYLNNSSLQDSFAGCDIDQFLLDFRSRVKNCWIPSKGYHAHVEAIQIGATKALEKSRSWKALILHLWKTWYTFTWEIDGTSTSFVVLHRKEFWLKKLISCSAFSLSS